MGHCMIGWNTDNGSGIIVLLPLLGTPFVISAALSTVASLRLLASVLWRSTGALSLAKPRRLLLFTLVNLMVGAYQLVMHLWYLRGFMPGSGVFMDGMCRHRPQNHLDPAERHHARMRVVDIVRRPHAQPQSDLIRPTFLHHLAQAAARSAATRTLQQSHGSSRKTGSSAA